MARPHRWPLCPGNPGLRDVVAKKRAPAREEPGLIEDAMSKMTLDEEPRMKKSPGNVLLSHQAALAVPSALEGLTAVFGMGTGVAPPP